MTEETKNGFNAIIKILRYKSGCYQCNAKRELPQWDEDQGAYNHGVRLGITAILKLPHECMRTRYIINADPPGRFVYRKTWNI